MRKRFSVAVALAGVLALVPASRPSSAAAPCEATCRQKYRGNPAAINACIRNCSASAGARTTTMNNSKSNSFRQMAPTGSTGPSTGQVAQPTTVHGSKSNSSSYREKGSGVETGVAQPNSEDGTMSSYRTVPTGHDLEKNKKAERAGVVGPSVTAASEDGTMSSYRTGGPTGATGPSTGQVTQPTTVHGSKSNSSFREAGSGMATGVAQPTDSTTIKSGQGNSSAGAPRQGFASRETAKGSKSLQCVVTNVDARTKTLTLKRADGAVAVMDASRLTGELPKIGQNVSVEYTSAGGKPTVVSIAVSNPGVPSK